MGAAAGLVTAIVAGVVAAVFGGSHLQVSGPTGAMTVVLLPVTAKHGVATVPLLAILAGLLVIAMALTAVGRAVEFIPVSVVEGFTIGIGVIIGLQQLPLILGTERGEAESTLVSSWLTLGATDWTRAWQPLVVAAGVIALHLVGHRFFRHLPLSLIAIVVATGAIARTAVNVRSGARTRLASVSHAVVLLLVMLLLGPLVSRIPMAALGGVLLVTAGRMINLRLVRTLTHRRGRGDPGRDPALPPHAHPGRVRGRCHQGGGPAAAGPRHRVRGAGHDRVAATDLSPHAGLRRGLPRAGTLRGRHPRRAGPGVAGLMPRRRRPPWSE
ncbi:hypothetical protein TESS_TESS_00807 [Tessaracoccus sp. O5.2]